jgi:hypothetical protein
MIAEIYFVLAILASPFKSKSRLEAENAALRRQLIVLRRKVKGRARLTNTDRWFFVQLYRWFPSILDVLTIIRPETLVRYQNPLVVKQGCAGLSRRSADSKGKITRRPRRTSSPLRPDLVFGTHGSKTARLVPAEKATANAAS